MADNKTNPIEDETELYVTLTLDDGSECECVVINIFEANGRDYISLLPVEEGIADEGEVFIYRYSEDEDGNPSLDNIESDEEFEIVSDAFDEILDEAEFDELVTDDYDFDDFDDSEE